jgi:hypothetical protein
MRRSGFIPLLAAIAGLTTAAFLLTGCDTGEPPSESAPAEGATTSVEIIPQEDEQRVDVQIGGELFTSYLYNDTLDVLKKPVLYPLITSDGRAITRGYPLEPRPGDRVDHPHHIGHWLNYGVVNGLDFWGHSNSEYSRQNPEQMGTIRHQNIDGVSSGEGQGSLEVSMNWINSEEEVLLEEDTRFVFHTRPGTRIIDRITTLTAQEDTVHFEDSKEGMIAVRLRRELEHPDDGSLTVITEQGVPSDEPVTTNEGVTGQYLSSEGVTGTDAWGKRAKWVRLSGVVENDSVAVAIIDHPEKVGDPTCWHARGYGLFSANPLGQAVFSEGAEEMNLSLARGESTTFRYRIVIHSDNLSPGQLDKLHDEFTKLAS